MSNSSQRAANASAPARATDSPDIKRRRFLLALGAGGAGAGAAAVATSALGSPVMPAKSPAEAESAQGYRETEHVRDYYATTRI